MVLFLSYHQKCFVLLFFPIPGSRWKKYAMNRVDWHYWSIQPWVLLQSLVCKQSVEEYPLGLLHFVVCPQYRWCHQRWLVLKNEKWQYNLIQLKIIIINSRVAELFNYLINSRHKHNWNYQTDLPPINFLSSLMGYCRIKRIKMIYKDSSLPKVICEFNQVYKLHRFH